MRLNRMMNNRRYSVRTMQYQVEDHMWRSCILFSSHSSIWSSRSHRSVCTTNGSRQGQVEASLSVVGAVTQSRHGFFSRYLLRALGAEREKRDRTTTTNIDSLRECCVDSPFFLQYEKVSKSQNISHTIVGSVTFFRLFSV